MPNEADRWFIDSVQVDKLSSVTEAFKAWRILEAERDYRIARTDESDEVVAPLLGAYLITDEILRRACNLEARTPLEIREKLDSATRVIEDGDTDDELGMKLLRSARDDIAKFDVFAERPDQDAA